jgi:glutamate N-acetyltransferase/amino-acid N-acetyltransferase
MERMMLKEKSAVSEIEFVPGGSVTTPLGFTAGAVPVGVRTDWDKLDVTLLYSEKPCAAAAVYTSNNLKAAPVVVTQSHLADGRAQAVVVNAGCANAATGKQGIDNAVTMAKLAGAKLGIDPHDVVVSSTGVIGVQLPMDRIAAGIEKIALTRGGGVDFAKAIMTTDTVPKYVAVRCGEWAIGGAVKGVGMIHPNMATMLCYVTTDAPVAQPFLAEALKEAVDASFNMIDVDSDTSTNDTVVVMANGMAGGGLIDAAHRDAEPFSEALTAVCTHLAKAMVADAEGGSKVIEVRVEGAASLSDARKAAREIVSSLGVKTAMYGEDPNWGRILAAVGNSGAAMDMDTATLFLARPGGGELCLYENGAPLPFDAAEAKTCLAPRDIRVRVGLGLGDGAATAWGSDLTEDYVRLNSLYTT